MPSWLPLGDIKLDGGLSAPHLIYLPHTSCLLELHGELSRLLNAPPPLGGGSPVCKTGLTALICLQARRIKVARGVAQLHQNARIVGNLGH